MNMRTLLLTIVVCAHWGRADAYQVMHDRKHILLDPEEADDRVTEQLAQLQVEADDRVTQQLAQVQVEADDRVTEQLRQVQVEADDRVRELQAEVQMVSLDGSWKVQGEPYDVHKAPISIDAKVPGDLITDLQRAGVIQDPLYELTFLNSSVWTDRLWTYTRTFTSPAAGSTGATALIILEGVKMGAAVFINGHPLGNVTDQFIRYNFTVTDLLLPGPAANVLTVQFLPSISTEGRYMAATGGWDWAPMSETYSPYSHPGHPDEHDHLFTFGIWRSVSLLVVPTNRVIITDLVPLTYHDGPFPTSKLTEANFTVKVDVHTWSPTTTTATVMVTGSWGAANETTVTLPAGAHATSLLLRANLQQVDLWWPLGAGGQPLYSVHVSVDPRQSDNPHGATEQTPHGRPPPDSFDHEHHHGGNDAHTADHVADDADRSLDDAAHVHHGHRRSSSHSHSTLASANRTIGFRSVALVTGNDTDSSFVSNASQPGSAFAEGSEAHGLYFRINGLVIASRGSNVVPMDNFEGRLSDAAHARMVRSVAEGNLNMLRVWGGGTYFPAAFYDEADRLGVMVYQDHLYSPPLWSHTPTGSESEEVEIRQNVRALAHHASIVAWNACNECQCFSAPTGGGLYSSHIMTTSAEEDDSRPIWPSCPSSGWSHGVWKLDSRPNGKPLVWNDRMNNKADSGIEAHGPYMCMGGFETVNGIPHVVTVDPGIPTKLPAAPAPTGPQFPNKFGSEFGTSAFSSFESMSPTLAPEHWGVHGGMPPDDCDHTDPGGKIWRTCPNGTNPMSQRNYACDSLIEAYFGPQDLNAVGEGPFKRQLYQCMISQALYMASEIQARRATNQFGLLTWMLNEIWPTGGFGSLEYGTVGHTPGQVIGGRWKPLHHMLARWLYRDVMAACTVQGEAQNTSLWCYVVNDGVVPFDGTVSLAAVPLTLNSHTSYPPALHQVRLPAGPGVREWFRVDQATIPGLADGTTQVLECVIQQSDGGQVGDHIVLTVPPLKLVGLPETSLTVTVHPDPPPVDSPTPVSVETSDDAAALYVTLTTLAQGRFSDNAFLVRPGQPKTLMFMPFEGFNHTELVNTIRADHLVYDWESA